MPAEHSIPKENSHRTLIIVVAVMAAIVIGGFFYLLLRRTVGDNKPVRLENAIRAGSPDFEKYRKLIALDEPVADEAKRPLGDMVMTLQTTARNFTGKTLIGLEIRAAVVDHQDQTVKEKTLVVIPGRRDELEPNKTMPVSIVLEGFKDDDDRANIKMEVVGFRFK
ncbi:MAG: hypothetical protein ACMG6H_12495 [Acidobacteriota bacterium]